MAVNKRLLQGAAAAGGLTPSEHFGVVLYEGDGTSSHSVTGLNFTPDLVWAKHRNHGTAHSHNWADSTRGGTKIIYSNTTDAQQTITNSIQTFDTGGFTVGNSAAVNDNGIDYVAWCFKANGGTTTSATTTEATNGTYQANVDSGFSIVTFTTSNSTVQPPPLNYCEHGLGVAPSIVIYKETNDSGPWQVNVPFISNNGTLTLNQTDAMSSGFAYDFFDSDSTNIAIRSNYAVSRNVNLVAYVFAEIEGFSKFGTYTGNGSVDGPIVETGFEPAFLMIKNTSISTAGSYWAIYDNKRTPSNPRDTILRANSGSGDFDLDSLDIDFLSNGFQVKGNYDAVNGNNYTYIYMAFAADPDTEAPTLADSFSTVTYTGNNSTQSIDGLGFQPNLIWIKGRDFGGWNVIQDSVRGAGKTIFTNVTNTEVGNSGDLISSFDSDGFGLTTAYLGGTNASTNGNFDYVAWAWKADDNEPTIYGGPAKAVYKFEDNANDVTGNNNGTVSGATYTTGKFNKAINFDGSGDYVTIPATDTTPLNFSSENFTISHWVYPHNTAESAIYSSKWSTGAANQRSYYFGHNASGNIIISENPGGSFTSTSTVTQNAWNHVVYVRNASTAYIYINGSLDSTHSRTNTIDLAGTQNIYFGRVQGTPSGDMYDGLMDQTRFYSGALSQEQVTELYNETSSDNDDLELGGPPEILISANANAGFSIVKYEGDGVSGKQVPHGLSAAPEMIIIKNLDTTSDWAVGHTSLGFSANKFLKLNLTNAEFTNAAAWASTNPDSTTFTLGDGTILNNNGDNHIAYCFHSVSGYSKFGSYSGSGASGNAQNVGFAPDLVILKSTNAVTSWAMFDTVRGANVLYSNLSNAESSDSRVTLTSTGFEFTGAAYNESGRDWIYMAFKINPTPYPLAGNMSFLVVAGGGSGGARDAGPGGAGGLRTSYGSTSGGGASAESDITLAAGTYTITVGSGGAKVIEVTQVTPGNSGTDSSISATGLTTITSIGGGGGGTQSQAASSGGSGGGGTASNQPGSGTSGQGFAGGNGTGSYTSGGGGGASETGNTPPSNENGGAGGDGLAVSITGSSVTYAGGGGGSGDTSSGSGGTGGGGAGQSNASLDATSGTANTGGGGGSHRQNLGTSGAGGSGVVILRLATSEYSGTTTGSPTVTTDGDYTVLTYTGSGTYVHS